MALPLSRHALVGRMVYLRRWFQRRGGVKTDRVIVLHIGPHKTGTTSIQYLLETNHLRLPQGYDLVRRREDPLMELKRLTYAMRTAEDAERSKPEITDAARKLALSTRHARVTIISHEDIVGYLPTRGGIRGLYPFAPAALRAVLDGLGQAGVSAKVVFYTRDLADWKESLFYYKTRERVARTFRPGAFDRRHGLPSSWDGLIKDLCHACGATPFHVIRFEDDRASGLMGRGLLKIAGLTDKQIARLRPVSPRNVVRQQTLKADEDTEDAQT